MKIIEIKSEKQDNGIWGMPLNCYEINNFCVVDDRKNLLFSAIITAINEKFNRQFKIGYFDGNGFTITVLTENFVGSGIMETSKTFYMKFDKYEVTDNILYEFDNEQEHLMFLRQKKLKRLENIL